MAKIDPVTFEVGRYGLLVAAAEMKSIVMRTAYSTVLREAGDLSCAVLNANCESVAQGPADIPVHLATMPLSAKGALEVIPMEELRPGDALFHNDPYHGNNHLPDCLMLKPIFYDDRIVAFSATRAHWTDIGGMAPGSYTTVTSEIYQEGLRIPPVKIYKQGELNRDVVDIIRANTRRQDERLGDLRAQYAGCITGERRVLAMIQRYGLQTVLSCMEEILDHAEKLTRAEIEKMREGTYTFTDYCDGDGVDDQLIKIHAAVTIRRSEIVVDFTGSAPQTRGGMNAPYAVTVSSVYYAIKAATDPWNPANSGSYRPVQVIAPEGSVLNPRFPAPVVAGNHETACRIIDVILGALAEAAPDRIPAAGAGSSVPAIFAGIDSRPGRNFRRFVYLEPHGVGWGARPTSDGINGMRVGVGNTMNQPVEIVELEYPLMIEAYELVQDAGGAGKFRGGLPFRRVYRILDDTTITLTCDRARVPPYGLKGGKPGSPTLLVLNPGTESEQVLPSKTSPFVVKAGTVLMVQSAGGGGWGNPFERDPESVRNDVINGYVSLDQARKHYGVVIDRNTYEVDFAETSRLRTQAVLPRTK